VVNVLFSVLSVEGSNPTHDAGIQECSCCAVSPVTEVRLVLSIVPIACMARRDAVGRRAGGWRAVHHVAFRH